MKRIKYLLFPLFMAGIFCVGLNSYLNKQNVRMLNEKNLYGMLYDTKSQVKDKGYYANEYLTDRNYILMMGSSELSHSTDQHPDNFFNTGRTKNGIITSGRAYTQDLQHASMVGSFNKSKNKKVVLLVSMQWFMDKKGERPDRFQTRFSPVIFYKYLENPKISHKTKVKYAQRVAELLEGTGDFKEEQLYAKLFVKKNGANRLIMTAMKPYFSLRKSMVRLKDKGILYSSLVGLPNKDPNMPRKTIDWKAEREKAIKDAEFRVGKKPGIFDGKPMFIDKGYFREYMKNKERTYKGMYNYVNMLDAKEFYDYKIFLDTCKETGVEPTIVLIPVVDQFYDYVGIDRNERAAFFAKVKEVTAPYGFRVIDESNSGSSRYFLRDVMHLGTVGWTDVCKQIYDIYEK
ncbi:MAG: D-alanyl-lipoteichoic acid biosynthesis protein DltD [Peptostreptococcus anaerobius]|nr:D-alanyl-lipoteichoic acid biosynthesis protein DltD [Peptostreptococcus anaerobius]